MARQFENRELIHLEPRVSGENGNLVNLLDSSIGDQHHGHVSNDGLPSNFVCPRCSNTGTSSDEDNLKRKIAELEKLVNDLQIRIVTAEDDLQISRKELASKIGQINQLQTQVEEKETHIGSLTEVVEVKQKEVEEQEKRVQTVQEELKTVKPEIVTKTREIEDKDKIIEEKNSQLEQQQKILVEIQITLDEKQKELEEYERKLRESQIRIKELEDQLAKLMKSSQVRRTKS
jgi:chromosome segregation protein